MTELRRPSGLSSDLRELGNELEELIRKAESMLEDAARRQPTAVEPATRRVLQLSLRDLASAHKALFRASLAESGVVQRVLGAVLGRPLGQDAAPGERASGAGAVLDPFRTHLADSAIEVDRLVKALSLVRAAMSDCEVEPEIGLPEWPEPAINFAAGMVDSALESLDEARGLLYGAADLTQDRLAHLMRAEPPDQGLETHDESTVGDGA